MNYRIQNLGNSISRYNSKGLKENTKLHLRKTNHDTLKSSYGKEEIGTRFGRSVRKLMHAISQLPKQKQEKLSYDGKLLKEFVIKRLGKEEGKAFVEENSSIFKGSLTIGGLKAVYQKLPGLHTLSQNGKDALAPVLKENSSNKSDLISDILKAKNNLFAVDKSKAIKIASQAVEDPLKNTNVVKDDILAHKRKQLTKNIVDLLSTAVIKEKSVLEDNDKKILEKAVQHFLSKEDFESGFSDRLSLFLQL